MVKTPRPETETTNNPDEFCLYMEKSTNIIYEAKYIGDFVIVRPATPALYGMIRRLTVPELLDQFEESYIDVQQFKSRTSEIKIGDQ